MSIKQNRLGGPGQSIHKLLPCSSICSYGPEFHWFQYSDGDLMYRQLGLYLCYSWWSDSEPVFEQAIADCSLRHKFFYDFFI